ncbi:MAG: hypothetical protein KAT28_00640 [Candidatus Aenigmarchaeota archaeon]|nr:hypothetical protein [Candidatus Aenigmarchaeota archaeon]
MGIRDYKKKVTQSLKKYVRGAAGENNGRNGVRPDEEQNQSDYIHSGRMDLLDDTFKHIITRIDEGPIGNKYIEILFGHDVWGKIEYDYLRVEETELGYMPTEFIYHTEDSEIKRVDLYSRMGTSLDDPYEPVFGPIGKHFKRKGSNLNYEKLVGLYLDSKEKLVEKTELTENQVFFVEQRSAWYPSYSKQQKEQ